MTNAQESAVPPPMRPSTQDSEPPASAARLRIDLSALRENFRMLQTTASKAEIAPVVKADAYGLGAPPIAQTLAEAGARQFFVATAHEGALLRDCMSASSETRIFILHGVRPDEVAVFRRFNLTPILNSLDEMRLWTDAVKHGAGPAGLHIDLGMNRLGVAQRDIAEAAALAKLAQVTLVMGHLSSASDPNSPHNARQAAIFAASAAQFPSTRRSLANSAAAFLNPAHHFDLVRPGIALYGGDPFDDGVQFASRPLLRSVAALTAPILQIRTLSPGDSVGYNAGFTAEKPMRTAILGLGYADGFLRAAGARGYGFLDGARRPILGRISMDLIVIDIGGAQAVLGDEVELLGPHVSLANLAKAAQTIPYEILTRIGSRVVRSYEHA